MKMFWNTGMIILLISLSFSCQKKEGVGCTDIWALNYNSNAAFSDGSCLYDTTGGPFLPNNFTAEMQTSYSENWDDWDFKFDGISGSVYTTYSENWDGWYFSFGGITGNLSTSYSENWDDWNLTTSNYSMSIETSYSENWDDWNVDDNNSSWHVDVATSYSENWDDWNATGDSVDLDLYTSYSENWDDWDVSGKFGITAPVEYKIAVLFVPVIVNVLRQQEIIP